MTAEQLGNTDKPKPTEVAGEDITPKKDGGVLKLLKREGPGTELPMTGDKIYVHYVGTLLDGTEFDRSQDDKFTFEIGKGQVIKGWDLGIATMKVGELSQFICKPEYAYGAAGSPPKIPPNATLVFQVELFDFHGEDITEDEDKGIIRRMITRGQGYIKPNEGALVEVTLEGTVNGRVFDDRSLKFEVGDGESIDLPVGVEKAIMSMEEGEESLFIIKPKYGYGNEGNDKFGISPAAMLQYRVKLNSFEKTKESWEMSTAEKLEQSALVKEKGTQYFKLRKYKQASVQYKRIVSWLGNVSDLDKDDEQRVRNLRLASHLNLAMCYLKLHELSLALSSCNKALELDEGNEKALFRRAEAFFSMKDYRGARDDFQQVVRLYPGNKAAKAQVVVCQRHMKEQMEKDKRLYANMFQKFAEKDAKKREGKMKDEKCTNGDSMEVEENGTDEDMEA